MNTCRHFRNKSTLSRVVWKLGYAVSSILLLRVISRVFGICWLFLVERSYLFVDSRVLDFLIVLYEVHSWWLIADVGAVLVP